jgi:hypothetical protein
MASPKRVSRKQYEEWRGVRWNAFVEICFSNIEDLTPAQRLSHLVFLYSSEVHNGGHYQYFVNKCHWDHTEVISVLGKIGAVEHAANLAAALKEVSVDPIESPNNVGQFLVGQTDHDLSAYDRVFYKGCSRDIEAWLTDYLDRNEDQFIEWIP